MNSVCHICVMAGHSGVEVCAHDLAFRDASLNGAQSVHNSPSDIEVLIWYQTRCEPHDRQYAPAVGSALKRFLDEGILEPEHTLGAGYTTTERGRKWLEMILATPYPEHRWIDPRTETNKS